jgi:hypothetical protein
MRIDEVAICVAYDTAKDAGAGVRGKPKDKLTHHVFGFGGFVVGWELVDFLEQLIDKPCDAEEIVACFSGDDDVLDFKFTNLRRVS